MEAGERRHEQSAGLSESNAYDAEEERRGMVTPVPTSQSQKGPETRPLIYNVECYMSRARYQEGGVGLKARDEL